MSEGPFSCYCELSPTTVVVAAEFFQCYDRFSSHPQTYLCSLTSSTISIYHVVQSGEGNEFEPSDCSLQLRFQKRVFGHPKSVRRYRMDRESDLLLIAIDVGKVVLAQYNHVTNTLSETILCQLEAGNDSMPFDGKQVFLGHGSIPIVAVHEQYQSILVSVCGETIVTCSMRSVLDSITFQRGEIKSLVLRAADIGLSGPILDVAFVNGYTQPTCVVLQQDQLLPIGHAARVHNTCSISVLCLSHESGDAAIIWRAGELPHDCLRLIPFHTNAFNCAVAVVSQNAVLVVHQECIAAQATNGFASVSMGSNPKISLQPWSTDDTGVELNGSSWSQYGDSSLSDLSMVGCLKDGSAVLLHMQYVVPGVNSSLEMKLVRLRDPIFAGVCCVTESMQAEFMFVSSRNGQGVLYRIRRPGLIRSEQARKLSALQYRNNFLPPSATVKAENGSSSSASAHESVDIEAEMIDTFGEAAMTLHRPSNFDWIVEFDIVDVLTSVGPIINGTIVKSDDMFSQVDHIRWNRSAPGYQKKSSTAAAFIPERESKNALLLTTGRNKDGAIARFHSGLAYQKSATKSFPGGKTMFSVSVFGHSLLALVYNNKSRMLRCETATPPASSGKSADTSSGNNNVKFQEWLVEDCGFIVTARTLYLAVLHESDSETIVLQVTPFVLRIVRIRVSASNGSWESEPMQDMSLHDSVDIGGLGGEHDEVLVCADSSTSHVVLLSSHMVSYFLHYDAAEESLEVRSSAAGNSGSLSPLSTHITSVSVFEANLRLPTVNWSEMLASASSSASAGNRSSSNAVSAEQKVDVAAEELYLYGEVLTKGDEQSGGSAMEVDDDRHPSSDQPLALESAALYTESSNSASADATDDDDHDVMTAFAVLTDKNGCLVVYRLDTMTCVFSTSLCSQQADHIPLQLYSTTSNGHASSSSSAYPPQDDTAASPATDSFVIESKVFHVASNISSGSDHDRRPRLYMLLVFSSGELVLYRFHEICGVAAALNKELSSILHTRRYPGVPYVRGINNSEIQEIPDIFMSSSEPEIICRLPPSVRLYKQQLATCSEASARVFLAASDPKVLVFDRGFPVLLPVAFPETPMVNFGLCTMFPLFGQDPTLVATLWYEYEDIDTASTAIRFVKNKPLKQSMLGIYRQLPRQSWRAGMQGTVQSVSVHQTVHKCMEMLQLTDNRTEYALLDRRTYLLYCSQDVSVPFDPIVVSDEVAAKENMTYERYFPSLTSYQQPNPLIAPYPSAVRREYRISLVQQGKVVDTFSVDEGERVIDATVLYFMLEHEHAATPAASGTQQQQQQQQQQQNTTTYERRIFVLVSTLDRERRAEDTQGKGRLLLLSLDYAMFEDSADANETADSATATAAAESAEVQGTATDADKSTAAASASADGSSAGASAAAPENTNSSNTGKATMSKAQQQFLGSIQPKLRLLWAGIGPASIVKQMPAFPTKKPMTTKQANHPWSNYVVATVGPILYVYKLNQQTMELEQVSFFFAQYYIASLTIAKQYLIIGDIFHSVQLLFFREDDFSLHLVAKDFDRRVIMETGVLADGGKLGIVTADDGGHIQIFQNTFKKPESFGGSRLLCQSEFNVGSVVTWISNHEVLYPELKRAAAPAAVPLATVAPAWEKPPPPLTPAPGRLAPAGFRAFTSSAVYSGSAGFHKKISSFPLQQFGVRMLKQGAPNGQKRICTVLSTQEGGLGMLVPVDEKIFKRLQSLEQIMNMLLPTTLALNPRDYRLLYGSSMGSMHHRSGLPGLRSRLDATVTPGDKTLHYQVQKTILDGVSLNRYLSLDFAVQEEIAQMIGTHAILLRENMREIEVVARFF